ncbi:PIN domain-like protein [Suillus lakei]|nr:PIN domain-like protein [Suillus lakei]
MGVRGLWTYLKPSATTESLAALALDGRYTTGRPPFRPFVIGVDVSVWFEQCQQVTRGRAHAQSGQNPPLRTFIFRTARLKSFPVQVIFAYDGPERPALKRGQKVATKKTHWMTKPTQRILDTFDIQWFTVCTVHLVLMFVLATDSSPQAKGEAEAELAAMNGAGMIDAVMTDDSDVFAFGGRLVLRNSSLSDSTVDVYRADIPHEDYALVSLLCGGDYDMAGLPGCGPATAFGLARCGLGHSLHAAESRRQFHGPFRQSWREDMEHQLRYDPMSRVGPDNISDTVPNIDTWSAYLNPAVSEPLVPVRQPGVPDVGKIAAAAVSLLGWEDADRLLNTFHNKIWPGVVTSELLQDLCTWRPDNQDVALAAAATRHFFLHFVCKKQTVAGLSGYNVRMPADALAKDTFRFLEHLSMPEGPPKPFRLWVPEGIYKAWMKFMWTSPLDVGKPSKGGPSSQDVIDLTNESDENEWVIDFTSGSPSCGSKSKGKSKAWSMDFIDLT